MCSKSESQSIKMKLLRSISYAPANPLPFATGIRIFFGRFTDIFTDPVIDLSY